MYELIVHYGKSKYGLFGDSLNIEDYPTIPVGAQVYVPNTGDLFFIHGPKKGFDLDNPINITSILGEAIIGEMELGG